MFNFKFNQRVPNKDEDKYDSMVEGLIKAQRDKNP